MKKTLQKYLTAFLLIANSLFPIIANAQFTKLHEFVDDGVHGINPEGSLISVGGTLYGMTPSGGPNGAGDIFKIKPDGTGYDTVKSFDGINGAGPMGDLLSVGGFLYGMNVSGMGKIFKIKPDGTGFLNIHSFSSSVDGFSPKGSLISDGTYLYGMTQSCGINNCGNSYGTIFKIMPDGTGFTLLHDFDRTTGSAPVGNLLSIGTFLYGTTSSGGTSTACGNGCGTIFKIKNDGTNFSVILNFDDTNGNSPLGSLITDGTYLYGTTDIGGAYQNGTIFKIMLDGTGYTNLFNFNLLDGENPKGDLLSVGGFLYGTTFHGGTGYRGTIFKIKSDGTSFSVVSNFDDGNDSNGPMGSLISDGTFLYGLTTYGGSDLNGTIFKFQYCTSGCGTDIQDNNLDNNLTIFPNPTNGLFNLKINTFENTQIKVYNVLGECIYQNISTSSNFQIDLSSQTSGVYFIQLHTEQGTINKKIIIQK